MSVAQVTSGSIDASKVTVPVVPDANVGKAKLEELVASVRTGERETTSRLLTYGRLCREYISERLEKCEEAQQRKERAKAIGNIELHLKPILGHVDCSRWLRYDALATQFGADVVACCPQSGLRSIITLQGGFGAKGETAIPDEWKEFVGNILASVKDGKVSGAGVGDAIETEQTERAKKVTLSKAEKKAAKEKAAKKQEAARTRFMEQTLEKAKELKVDLADLLPESEDGATVTMPSKATPESVKEFAGTVHWTDELVNAFIHGMVQSNHDNRAAMAMLLARLQETVKKMIEAQSTPAKKVA